MGKNKNYIDYDDLDKPIHSELNDYREERKLMAEQIITTKNEFAETLKGSGEDMKESLRKNESIVLTTKKESVFTKISRFFDKLSRIC